MSETNNKFEQFIRNSMTGHEVPYETGAWEAFSNKTKTPWHGSKLFLSSLGAGVLLAGLAFLIPSKQVDQDLANQTINHQLIKQVQVGEKPSQSMVETAKKEVATTSISQPITDFSAEEKTSFGPAAKLETTETASIDASSPQHIKVPGSSFTSPQLETNQTADEPIRNTITASSFPSVEFNVKEVLCKGESFELYNTGLATDYLWKLDGETVKENASYVLEDLAVGTHTIALATNHGEVFNKTVTVIDAPNAAFDHQVERAGIVNSHVFSTTQDPGNTKISWVLAGKEVSTALSFKHSFIGQGMYPLTCIKENGNGCISEYKREIPVPGYYNFRKEMAFSPNGDGLNDVFMPVELKTINRPFSMSIYNRGKEQIFTTNSIDNPWDGRDQTGSKVKANGYVWVIDLKNEIGVREQYVGTIMQTSE